MSTHIYSLYLIFFVGMRDGITLKVYSHTVKNMDAERVNFAYRYQTQKPEASGKTLQSI
ncbi:hypothetical protein EC847_102388 [Scandinavium goeteborgense]|uniref:Uncharacterized protein n=1 Tax=Scandinavium goeteborgense TaxID=1851514 RepID=A0A4R6ER30_SCAGO|nr:hypothetical protein EC847_102388 [Scandinavium goeteborgense]